MVRGLHLHCTRQSKSRDRPNTPNLLVQKEMSQVRLCGNQLGTRGKRL